ncbi:hypothetical protein SODALDRAFT_326635 [Sodiomyces alkalinus F11]|uniref:Uncharacterized protein n=1 Tax=Sodiomyces alkalinus (strain CBS 110278 / VKM F-3762 / F11) TaxID=1314773 RepID=A0A3N2Q6R3_SODAK|nr:hypothetical protein SODALDRAFT_326635 [Sodiomyces alkalinus F11]ROT42479.1 hypothetical protein SODALDRAFT_326635 [Sodiomyces alkalinus F11]
MDGYSAMRDPDDYGPEIPSAQSHASSGRMPTDGYTKEMVKAFRGDAQDDHSMNTNRPRDSALVDLNDPIQVHLLTETALSDSKTYQILSQEEVDDLKKQSQLLTQRIEQTRANLIIQSKYRDAAISVAKLYGAQSQEGGKRPSFSDQDSESAREAEMERQESERICEELTSELWNLEKRLMEPQRRLLEHTAGILQLTHKASKKAASAEKNVRLPPNHGIPGSPESLYTFSKDRNSMEAADDAYLDGQHVGVRGLGGSGLATNLPKELPIEPPQRSPIREQTTQIRDENERLRAENDQLAAQVEMLSTDLDGLREVESTRQRWMAEAEQRVGSLSGSLRDALVRLDPEKKGNCQPPPSGPPDAERSPDPGSVLDNHLHYLEQGLMRVQETHETRSSEQLRDAESAAATASIALAQAEARVDTLNAQLRDLLATIDPNYPDPPDSSNVELGAQFDYAEKSLQVVEAELARAAETSASGALQRQDVVDQTDAVLVGLWEIIQNGYADIQQRREQRRRMRQEQGLELDEEDMSGDDDVDATEPYTLSSFSTRVQWLYTQATKLKDQKSVLKRQIKQQRELNNKSDSAKDAELRAKDDEVTEVRTLLHESQQEVRRVEGLLSDALKNAEDASARLEANHSTVSWAEEQLQERDAKIEALEADGKAIQSRMAAITATIQQMESSLDKADEDVAALSTKLAEAEARVRERDAKIETLEAEGNSIQSRMAAITATVQQMESGLDKADEDVAALSTKLAEAEKAVEEKQQEADAKAKLVKEQEDEIERFHIMIAELKTELTIAQAELEGAYGSRKERAVEAAALKNSAEVGQFKAEVESLKDELAATLKELEIITAETIGAEREKLAVETRLDDALAARAALELEVAGLRDRIDAEARTAHDKMAKLQEELDAERLRAVPTAGGSAGARPGAGASMLSEQFRATMKRERKKFQEDLREEQARRRRLEDELQKLRKAVGPGKSPLSPR